MVAAASHEPGLSIIRLYSLTPNDLFFKYEAFLLSRPSGLRSKLCILTVDTAKELRREIQREHQAKVVASSASEVTPKASVGVRKGKGAADLGGLCVFWVHANCAHAHDSLDNMLTPSRPKAKQTPVSRPSTNGHAGSNGASSAFTPTSASPSHNNSFATPSRPSPMGPSGSSYRPGPSKLAAPTATPIGRSAPSSPVHGAESPSL